MNKNKQYSYNDVIKLKKINDKWQVEYEVYFNPHANPKQLMDIRTFDSLIEAIEWSKKYIQEYFEHDIDSESGIEINQFYKSIEESEKY